MICPFCGAELQGEHPVACEACGKTLQDAAGTAISPSDDLSDAPTLKTPSPAVARGEGGSGQGSSGAGSSGAGSSGAGSSGAGSSGAGDSPPEDSEGSATMLDGDAGSGVATGGISRERGSSGSAPSPSSGGLGEGTKLGRYEIRRELGRGGMGMVFLAFDPKLDRNVALKVVIPEQGSLSEEFLQRFDTEARAAAGLSHPNLVPIFDVGVCDGRPFFTMEFIEGRTLADEIAEMRKLPLERSVEVLTKLSDAIHYAHGQGVLHRDLKPANILIDKRGEPRIMDFGLAKRMDAESGVSLAGQVFGTPAYMSPEQAEGKHDLVDQQSDVYSLGAVLYRMLTGRGPFQGDTALQVLKKVLEEDPVRPSRLREGLPGPLEAVCMKALAKTKKERYQTAAELAADVERFAKSLPVHAPSVKRKAAGRAKGRRIGGIVAALAVVGVVVGGLFYVSYLDEAREKAAREQRESAQPALPGGMPDAEALKASIQAQIEKELAVRQQVMEEDVQRRLDAQMAEKRKEIEELQKELEQTGKAREEELAAKLEAELAQKQETLNAELQEEKTKLMADAKKQLKKEMNKEFEGKQAEVEEAIERTIATEKNKVKPYMPFVGDTPEKVDLSGKGKKRRPVNRRGQQVKRGTGSR